MTLKLAIIGCGAITEGMHLPVAAADQNMVVTALVDNCLSRARALAETYEVKWAFADYRECLGKVDAAVVATPHHLHAPVTHDLLSNGVHVLVEKPMALNSVQCDLMLNAAKESGTTLAVGLVYRFFPGAQMIKEILDAGWLGEILEFDFRNGNIFSWQTASDFFFRKETAGGGVLIDMGSHTLDLLQWWLGDHRKIDYFDDADGGVEADCKLFMELQNGARGVIELSRTRALRNTYRIIGSRGEIEISADCKSSITMRTKTGTVQLSGQVVSAGQRDHRTRDAFKVQLKEFHNAIMQHRASRPSGEEAKKVAELIDTCYAEKRRWRLPWAT